MNDRAIGRAGFLGILGAGAARSLPRQGRHRAARPRGAEVGLGDRADRPAGASTRSGRRCRASRPTAYRLRVDGLVGAPKTFTLADLKAMPRAEQVSDFHCVTGWVVKDVRWAGVRIADVLERAGA